MQQPTNERVGLYGGVGGIWKVPTGPMSAPHMRQRNTIARSSPTPPFTSPVESGRRERVSGLTPFPLPAGERKIA